jgi:hypothetical protein
MNAKAELVERLKSLPPLVRPFVFREEVLPMGTTRFAELRKRGLLDVTSIDGVQYVVMASAIRLIESGDVGDTPPNPRRVAAAARVRAAKPNKPRKPDTRRSHRAKPRDHAAGHLRNK